MIQYSCKGLYSLNMNGYIIIESTANLLSQLL